ncbi:hypothetical protein AQUCO_00400230v1 [Aquilegia coerulea]|uniref:CN hydrolase domain-containing protein n=1 Tax=Aquilegia coerulea TaxID=218851 RepID=A0A2G5ETY1_AQUCA|nr:hypothetical protein AQUCO_00400230v1 [Aquilegia coerulea]
MEIEEQQQQQQQQLTKKRQRVDSSDRSSSSQIEKQQQRNNSRVRVPANCATGLAQLTQELGLRSNGEAIHWLLEQTRPDLVSPFTSQQPITTTTTTTILKKASINKLPENVIISNNNDNVLVANPVAFAYPKDGINGKISALVPIANGGDFVVAQDEENIWSHHHHTIRPTVSATVVQASTVFYDTPATLDKAERLIAGAAARGSQLVVFPEAFVGGYPRFVNFDITDRSHSIEENEEFKKYHAAAVHVPGPEIDRLAEICRKYKVYLVMGVVEKEGFTLYSTLLFFDSKGQYLGKHRKLILTASESEHMVWHSGDEATAPVYRTSVGKIGGLTCWDNRLPPLRTELYVKGVEIYCAPTADARDAWKASMTNIAVEGGCFVLCANQFCQRKDYPLPSVADGDISPDSVVCAGGSVIISPSGAILAGPNYQEESLISADLGMK